MSDPTEVEIVPPSNCPTCRTRLASGTCPACALVDLLEGEDPQEEETEAANCPEQIDFGRYTLCKKRATGGMGVVYEAEDQRLKRTVALKMIRGSSFANEAELARFTIEAEAAATLDHPNIVPIYEVGQLDRQPYFTMKLIEGESLAERLKRDPDMSPREIAGLLSQISRAVHHAHKHGVLHRDLKPGNILLDGKSTPWLTDFGLAKFAQVESSLTLTSDSIGTPDYMSPEIAGGKIKDVSTVSDVWALGVILWEMLFGVPPFRGSGTVETMRRIVETEPVKLRGVTVDQDLVTLALRCLEKDPARRMGSAEELADELDRWMRGEPIKARRITSGERLVKWTRRNRALAALYAALLVGGLVFLSLWHRAESAVDSLTDSNAQLEETLAIINGNRGNRLAVEARLQVKEDPSRALLLAVEAVETGERNGAGVLPAAAESLSAILQEVGGIEATSLKIPRNDFNDGYINRRLAENYAPIISPDSRWMVSFDYTDWEKTGIQAALFDLSDIGRDGPVLCWTMWEKMKSGQLVSWLPDSRRIFSLADNGDIVFWEPFSELGLNGIPPSQTVGNVGREGLLPIHFRLSKRCEGGLPRITVVYAAKSEYAAPGVVEEETDTFLSWIDVDPGGEITSVEDARLCPLPWGYSLESDIAVSPGGGWALLYGYEYDKAVHLVQMDGSGDGLRIEKLPEEQIRIAAPAFSESGAWLTFQIRGIRARLYDLRSKDPTVAATTGRDLASFDQTETYFMAISPDDRWIASAANTSEIKLAPIDPDDGGWPTSVRVGGEDAYVVRFSNDSRWLAAGSIDRVASVWPMEDINRAPEPMLLRGLPTAVVDIVFSPDDQNLIALGLHCIQRQFQVGSGSAGMLPKTLPGEKRTINDIALSPDGRWVASACGVADTVSTGGWVKWSDVGGGGEVILDHQGHSATGVAFSRDGEWFASTGRDGTAKVWKCARVAGAIESGEPIPKPDFVLDMTDTRLLFDRKLAFHPRGTLYVTCGDGVLFEWDMKDPDPPSTRVMHFIHTILYLLPDLEISPDGKWLAVCRHGWDHTPKEGTTQVGNMVLLFDVSKPGPPVLRAELPASFLEQSGVTFSADNRWLATSGSGYGASVWDLEAEDIVGSKIISEVSAHRMTGLGFSPDGKWLALGASDGRIHLWDWKDSGQIRTSFENSEVIVLTWLDSDRLITGGKRGRISIWQTNTDRLKELARKTAGRELTDEEIERFGIAD